MSISHITLAATIVCLLFTGCALDGKRPTIRREGNPDAVEIAASDAAILSAIQTARQTVGEFTTALDTQTPGRSDFTVKFPFEQNGDVEHMWIVNLKHTGGKLKGTVDNEPTQITNIKLGQIVEIDAKGVSDWMYLENGKIVGAFTIKAIYKNYPEADRRQLEDSLGGTIDWD